jgi:hypothetical protein
MTFFFYRTIGCRVGRKADTEQAQTPFYDVEEIPFKTVTPETGGAYVELFTGPKVVTMPLGYEVKPRALIQSYLPFPMCVTHVVSKMSVSEG